mgnify:CR=1 FL=1
MIYLDNAATTYIKPKGVAEAVSKRYANPGRGGSKVSLVASGVVYECREKLCALLGIDKPQNIIFTSNTTDALNLAIKGIIHAGDHVILSGMEHNSVIRPVISTGAEYSVVKPNRFGMVSPSGYERLIKHNTKMIITTHASNITGTINPIREIGKLAKSRGILFLVDAAQTAGALPINVIKDNIDLLAIAGHKLLFGPQGTGALYIRDGLILTPLKEGGTGSMSESLMQPDFCPDRYESGTLNTNGIAGLSKGVEFIQNIGIDKIRQKEMRLTQRLINGLSGIKNVTIYGPKSSKEKTGIVSFNIENGDSVAIATELDSKFGIVCRGGLHCSALGHQSMGTLKTGMVRLSVCHFTTEREVDKAIKAVKSIAKKYSAKI